MDRFALASGDDFYGLKSARDAVGEGRTKSQSAHLDTGYFKNHKLLPAGLDHERQRNFIAGENRSDASDPGIDGVLRNPGHGMGTLSILAGGRLEGMVRVPIGGTQTDINSGDFYGGAPAARIVPMRIANSVVHFSTLTVAEAIAEARRLEVDVISMSMGGLPSAAWADAVNAAYEAGIVIVCAAVNNFGGFPTLFDCLSGPFPSRHCCVRRHGERRAVFQSAALRHAGLRRAPQQDVDSDGRLHAQHPVGALGYAQTRSIWTGQGPRRQPRRSLLRPHCGWRSTRFNYSEADGCASPAVRKALFQSAFKSGLREHAAQSMISWGRASLLLERRLMCSRLGVGTAILALASGHR